MMKKFTIALSLFGLSLLAFNAKAQDDKPQVKSYIGISSGLSYPLGLFKSTDYNNNKSGFAKKGVVIALDGSFKLYNNLSLTTIFSYQDHGQLNNNDETILSNGYRASYNDYTSTVTGSNRYTSLALMLGPQYSFLFGKFTVDARVFGGFIKSLSTPQVEVDLTDFDNKFSYFTQYSSSSIKLAYGGGVGLRYNITDGIGFALRETLYNTVSDGLKIENSTRTTTAGRVQTRLPITEAQTTLGILFNL